MDEMIMIGIRNHLSCPTSGNINIGSSTSIINIKNQNSASGSVNIMTGSSNSGSINLATGTGGTAVSIGSGETQGPIAIGNTSNTTSIAGTVNIGSAGLTTNINNMAGATGTVNIMSGAGSTGTINLGMGSGSVKVNIGSNTTTGAITIGNTGNTTTIAGTVNIGSAGLTTNINNVDGATGTVNIMSGAGSTGTINLATGSSSAKVNISNGTTTGIVNIGNTGNAVNINSSALSLGSTTKSLTVNAPITTNYLTSAISLNTQIGFKINGTPLSTTLTGSAPNNLYQVSLIPGIWLIQGNVRYATPGTFINLSISATSLTFDQDATVLVSTAGITAPIQQVSRIVNITSGTPIWYLVSGCQIGTVVTNVVFNVYRLA